MGARPARTGRVHLVTVALEWIVIRSADVGLRADILTGPVQDPYLPARSTGLVMSRRRRRHRASCGAPLDLEGA